MSGVQVVTPNSMIDALAFQGSPGINVLDSNPGIMWELLNNRVPKMNARHAGHDHDYGKRRKPIRRNPRRPNRKSQQARNEIDPNDPRLLFNLMDFMTLLAALGHEQGGVDEGISSLLILYLLRHKTSSKVFQDMTAR